MVTVLVLVKMGLLLIATWLPKPRMRILHLVVTSTALVATSSNGVLTRSSADASKVVHVSTIATTLPLRGTLLSRDAVATAP